MTLTIVAIPSGFNSNAYPTVAEATAYFEARYGSTDWDAGSADNKKVALIEASKLVDTFRFRGSKYRTEPEQPFQFPRDYQNDVSGVIDSTSLDSSNRLIVDADLAGEEYYPNDYFNYWACEMRTGDAEFEILLVTDFAKSTGTLTLEGDFSVAPAAGDEFRLIEKVPNEIKYATFEIANWILSGGANDLLDPTLTNYSIGEFSEAFAKSVEAKIPARAKYFLNKYINRLGNMI